MREEDDGGYVVRIAASDIGTGSRTVLTQIAADALDVPLERVRVDIGDSDLPFASLAGGSMGTASWGTAIVRACEKLRAEGGREAFFDSSDEIEAQDAHVTPRLRRAVLRGPRRRGHRRGDGRRACSASSRSAA